MWFPVPVPVDTSGALAPKGHAQVLSIYLPMLSRHWDVECEMREERLLAAPGPGGAGTRLWKQSVSRKLTLEWECRH